MDSCHNSNNIVGVAKDEGFLDHTGMELNLDSFLVNVRGLKTGYGPSIADQLINTGVKCVSTPVDSARHEMEIIQFDGQENKSNNQDDADPIGHDKVNNDAHLYSKTIDGYDFGTMSSFPDDTICGSVNGIIGLGKGDDDVLGHLIEDLPNPFISLHLSADSDDCMLAI